MSELISKLSAALEKSENLEEIEKCEEAVIKSIQTVIECDEFYELQTKEILKIIQKSNIYDEEPLCNIATKMSKKKSNDAPLLLNVFKVDIDAEMKTYIDILSCFNRCPLCAKLAEMYKDNQNLPERDYDIEIKNLKRDLAQAKKELMRVKLGDDFEDNVFNAAKNGKLTSIQYIYEYCHETVDNKDIYGFTPIYYAAQYGHLDVIKYLYETCHADPEVKDNFESTPLIKASLKGHLDIVKYLVEVCHANPNWCNSHGYSPIHNAARSDSFEVVKYLCEHCHVTITDKIIADAKSQKIKDYLKSKMKK